MNVLLGLTGSVATTVGHKLANALKESGHTVRIIMTEPATHFLDADKLRESGFEVFRDGHEWLFEDVSGFHSIWKKDDRVLHVELRKWADALVIAPLSANTLAKMAHGMCDNLLTSIYLAWDLVKPVIVAPAMNTLMWQKNVVQSNLSTIRQFSAKYRTFQQVPPIAKMLACGDEGEGAMARIEDIVKAVNTSFQWHFPLCHCNGIPVGNHPGAFLVERNSKHNPGKKTKHTGVDLYCNDGDMVRAVEAGRVVGIEPFTGPKIDSPWWNNTDIILIEGLSGVVGYGEVASIVSVGDSICRGQYIARVKRVLPEGKERPDIPGHSTSMLHLEFYPHGTTRCSCGYEEDKEMLWNPTSFLVTAMNAPKILEMK